MVGSLTSVFGEIDDLQDALSADGVLGLVPAEPGRFCARLTQITLDGCRLTAGEEKLPRIAFIAVPATKLLVVLPIERTAPAFWAGTGFGSGEIVTIAGGERVHERTVGPRRWASIQVPERVLAQYGRVLTGTSFAVPPGLARWRPMPAAARALHTLYRTAIRKAEAGSGAFADAAAAHGLEQELLLALIHCLADGPAAEETQTALRHRRLMARFEDLLRQGVLRRVGKFREALGVSERLFRECCRANLGMGAAAYRRLVAMQQVHRALRLGDPAATSVAAIAARHGIRDAGRFAGNYRALYGELPSATLRRGRCGRIANLAMGRTRINSP